MDECLMVPVCRISDLPYKLRSVHKNNQKKEHCKDNSCIFNVLHTFLHGFTSMKKTNALMITDEIKTEHVRIQALQEYYSLAST